MSRDQTRIDPRRLAWAVALPAMLISGAAGPALARDPAWAATDGAVTGCIRHGGEGEVCIRLSCERPGRIDLRFFEMEGDAFPSRFSVSIDGHPFPISLEAGKQFPWGYGFAARPVPAGLVEAIAKGKTLRYRDTYIAKGFEGLTLDGAAKPLADLANRCGIHRP